MSNEYLFNQALEAVARSRIPGFRDAYSHLKLMYIKVTKSNEIEGANASEIITLIEGVLHDKLSQRVPYIYFVRLITLVDMFLKSNEGHRTFNLARAFEYAHRALHFIEKKSIHINPSSSFRIHKMLCDMYTDQDFVHHCCLVATATPAAKKKQEQKQRENYTRNVTLSLQRGVRVPANQFENFVTGESAKEYKHQQQLKQQQQDEATRQINLSLYRRHRVLSQDNSEAPTMAAEDFDVCPPHRLYSS